MKHQYNIFKLNCRKTPLCCFRSAGPPAPRALDSPKSCWISHKRNIRPRFSRGCIPSHIHTRTHVLREKKEKSHTGLYWIRIDTRPPQRRTELVPSSPMKRIRKARARVRVSCTSTLETLLPREAACNDAIERPDAHAIWRRALYTCSFSLGCACMVLSEGLGIS